MASYQNVMVHLVSGPAFSICEFEMNTFTKLGKRDAKY